jgi:hypothetical protein
VIFFGVIPLIINKSADNKKIAESEQVRDYGKHQPQIGPQHIAANWLYQKRHKMLILLPNTRQWQGK